MANFRINVIIDPSGAKRGGRATKRELKGIERAGTRVGRVLATAFAFAGLTIGIGQLVQLGNEFQTIQNRLRVVTDGTEGLTAANERLFDIAQKTRQSFGSIVGLFSRASIAAGELGASQEQLFQLVEITGQALAVQGGAASESSGAIRQLSQAFSSGIVRGEEFNSILEGAFPLALAAAAGIEKTGGSVGKLRTLIIKGEITSREFFEGILAGGQQLEEQFGKTLPIISQAFTVLRNSLVKFTGELDSSAGVTVAVSGVIIDFAFALDDLTLALTGTLDDTNEITSGMKVFASAILIASQAVGLVFLPIISQVGLLFRTVGEAAGAFAAQTVAVLSGDFAGAQRIGTDFKERVFGDFTDTFTDLREDLIGETSETIEKLIELWDSSARDIAEAQSAAIGGDDEDGTTGLTDAQKEILEKQAEFILGLEQTEKELKIQQEAGEGAAAALRLYRVEIAAAKLGGEDFVELARDITAGINFETEALERLIETQANQESDTDTLEGLREQLRLLMLTREERAVQQALAELSAEATAAQRVEVEALAAEIFALEEAERAQLAFFDQFVRDTASAARSALSGALSDPLGEGLGELPARFAGVLQDLASDFLASEIFKLLAGIGGGEGGILGAIGTFFGQGIGLGGFQTGGGFRVGGSGGPDSQLVAFKASPMENVTITTPGQTAAAQEPPIVNVAAPSVVVVDSMEKAVAAIQTAEGEEAVLSVLRNNPQAVRSITGA